MLRQDAQFENFLNDKLTEQDYQKIGQFAGKRDITEGKNLDNLAGIAVGIATKEQVRAISYGEVLMSETINEVNFAKFLDVIKTKKLFGWRG